MKLPWKKAKATTVYVQVLAPDHTVMAQWSLTLTQEDMREGSVTCRLPLVFTTATITHGRR